MRGNPGTAARAPRAGAVGPPLDGLTDSEYTPNRSDPFGVSYEMATYRRTLDLTLPRGQSAFLWGPRKTGKSTLLRQSFPRSVRFDLLDTRLLLELTRAPWSLTERVRALDPAARANPIIIDEVQRVPPLLDEVHRLMKTTA